MLDALVLVTIVIRKFIANRADVSLEGQRRRIGGAGFQGTALALRGPFRRRLPPEARSPTELQLQLLPAIESLSWSSLLLYLLRTNTFPGPYYIALDVLRHAKVLGPRFHQISQSYAKMQGAESAAAKWSPRSPWSPSRAKLNKVGCGLHT